MKRVISSILIIIIAGSLPILAGSVQDDQARRILDALSGKTISAPSVSVDFTIIMSSMQDNFSEEFEGNLIMKGEMYRLYIMDMESWFDGNSVFTYMPDINEVIISDPDEDGGLLSNPASIFTMYDEQFNYRLIGEVTENGKRLYEIDLHPRDLDNNFHTVKLFVEHESNFLHSAVIAAKDGNRYTFIVNKYDTTKQLPDSYFVFDQSAHPGLEVIDMRW